MYRHPVNYKSDIRSRLETRSFENEDQILIQYLEKARGRGKGKKQFDLELNSTAPISER